MPLPKMKVKFKESLGGIGFVYGAGQIVDLPAHEAKDWIGQGLAEEVQEEEKPQQRPVTIGEVKAETRPIRRTAKRKR